VPVGAPPGPSNKANQADAQARFLVEGVSPPKTVVSWG